MRRAASRIGGFEDITVENTQRLSATAFQSIFFNYKAQDLLSLCKPVSPCHIHGIFTVNTTLGAGFHGKYRSFNTSSETYRMFTWCHFPFFD